MSGRQQSRCTRFSLRDKGLIVIVRNALHFTDSRDPGGRRESGHRASPTENVSKRKGQILSCGAGIETQPRNHGPLDMWRGSLLYEIAHHCDRESPGKK